MNELIKPALATLKKDKLADAVKVIEYEDDIILGFQIDGSIYEISQDELENSYHKYCLYSNNVLEERQIYNYYQRILFGSFGLHYNCQYNKPHSGTIGITDDNTILCGVSAYGPNYYIDKYRKLNKIFKYGIFSYCLISYPVFKNYSTMMKFYKKFIDEYGYIIIIDHQQNDIHYQDLDYSCQIDSFKTENLISYKWSKICQK